MHRVMGMPKVPCACQLHAHGTHAMRACRTLRARWARPATAPRSSGLPTWRLVNRVCEPVRKDLPVLQVEALGQQVQVDEAQVRGQAGELVLEAGGVGPSWC